MLRLGDGRLMVVYRVGSDRPGSADVPGRPDGGLYAAYSRDDAYTFGQSWLLDGMPGMRGHGRHCRSNAPHYIFVWRNANSILSKV
jgi:hypothetical protein